ncbi:MAG TPA: NAD(P)-binding domain-containing protein [Trebonia sp.]|jgi:3-hydroxyisobutyrate dehydrogenase-like beta-hydroxyacid dehydrogenase/alkylhydroperoxidase/carboxymuconolactone decarboxylase family protein YurZ|nr:NAD(P)-binding domain-containing protein [Trebonia sp.]
MPDAPKPTIAFVGLGNMGSPMAGRLVDAGYEVRGFDVSDAARDAFAARGGKAAGSATEAATGASIVILMLPDSGVVEAVATEPSFTAALAAGAGPGAAAVLVDMSSSEPARTRALAASLRAAGASLIDAPVSGGVKGAVSGKLAVMVGGADEDVAPVQDVLAVMGKVYRAGPVGAGHAVKALNNLMSATHLLVSSEAIEAGRQFGLDPEVMLSIFNASSGRSGSTENKWPNFILPETYNSGFGLRLMLKDMRIATGLAAQQGVPSRLGEQAAGLWARAAEALPPTADHTEIARWLPTSQDAPSEGGEMALTPRQEEIKAQFIEVRGTWGELWETILRLDPEFLLAYMNFSAVPWRHGVLPPKVKELIYIAIDANATHMYLPGVRQHVKAALAAGATGAEIMEVLELAATLGIHAMNIGVPILVEVLQEKGLRAGPAPLNERQEEIKAEFTQARGYWHEFWDEMLELDPELLAAYTEFSAVPWRTGTLEPKVKELVYIAFDTAATHLYVKGLKAHISNAIGYGATAQEVLEVMEIASVLGIHGVTTAAPILAEELAAFEAAKGDQ